LPVDFNRNVHCLLGLPFDVVDMAAAVGRVRSAANGGAPCFLSTPNLNFLIACRGDAAFRASVINSDLSVADGMPLVWMARLLGMPIRQRVAGSSLFEALRRDVAPPLSVYFFGGPDGVAERACKRLNAESSGLTCVGFECPGFGSVEAMSSDPTIDRINASGAAFLVVALGAKKGQAWIVHNRSRLTVPVISHLGAVVNFVAGTVARAPRWMQRSGLEWIWRIKEEPGLLPRYWQDGLAMFRLLATRILPYAWLARRQRPSPADLAAARAVCSEAAGATVIRLAGAWNAGNLGSVRACFAKAAGADTDIMLDLSGVSHVDSAFIGLAMLLYGHQAERGSRLVVKGITTGVRRMFELSCADFMLEQ
jgi:N-acetylglucosaminyldiphosphoundecaprenol N-acetyl-beta-D-mannosaminyltransferase